jgi:hypothetical protein
MYKRLVSWLLLASIILATLVPTILSTPSPDEPPIWDDEWSFSKEITLPIDTSSKYAQYQPVDIRIEFDDICWAKDEKEHSVRVCFWDGVIWHPLESQIYDLNYTNDEHISSCSLVFLIPKEANGEERYYVHYDDDKKSNPNYPNHVDVSEDYYRYQQIPGVIFESDYYEIIEEGYIVYGVNKEGKAFDATATQQVAKVITGTKEVAPNKGEIGASFDFRYWWMENGKWRSPYVASRLVKNQIIVDGNLMVKVGIESESPNGFLKSTVIYKYYYCPTEDKRIYTHVRHEVIDYPLPTGEKIDAGYVTLGYGNVKSSTIEELNFGKIYPYLHFYSDEERIKEYNVPQFPEGELQAIIIKEEDPDLGSSPWISVDDGEKGKAHAIIFESTNVTKSGYTGRDGITLELYETNNAQFPGLNARLAMLFILKDTYEEGEKFLNTLPEDFVVEFNAEFFTTENGGYPAVAEEAKMYQSLIQYQPTDDDDIADEEEEIERFNLTASVHFAPSFPLGFYISTRFGYNVSFLTAEVYKENSITSSQSGTVTRVSLEGDIPPDLKDMTLLELLDLLDWKNLTRCKKVHLPYLEKGRYLIKIFKEDPLFGEERQFIGYAIVDLEKNKEIHIYCKREGKVSLSFLNQEKTGIENVQIYLKKDDFIIANSESDSDGKAIIKAPCGLREKYSLNVFFKGFLIKEEQIRLGRIRQLIPLKKAFSFDVHDLEISIRDSEGKIPDFDVELSLTSKEMHDPVTLKEDNVSDGVYKFNDLYPANYVLTIKYNSYEIKKEIKIPDVDSLEIKLYDFTAYIKDTWNLSPEAKLDVILISEDFEKTAMILGEQLSLEKYHFTNIYPGNYKLKVRYKTYTIEEFINIPDRENIEIIFPALYNITLIIHDSHGNQLKDANISMIREGKEVHGITNDNGEIIFSLPPGSYVTKIFYDGDLIAIRQVEIFNNKQYKVVTTNEPLLPYIAISLSIITFIGVVVISYRKKDTMFFLKILAVLLVVVAIVSPWWELNGSSSNPDLETSTKLFLTPTKMVTISSNNNVTAGEIVSLDKAFINMVDTILLIVIAISFILIISSLILNRYSLRRFSLTAFLAAIAFYIGIIIMFISEMSKLANTTVGSLIGNGNLEISIPGEKLFETIACGWGPSIGFYLLLCSTIILIFAFYLNTRQTIFKYLKKIKQLK